VAGDAALVVIDQVAVSGRVPDGAVCFPGQRRSLVVAQRAAQHDEPERPEMGARGKQVLHESSPVRLPSD